MYILIELGELYSLRLIYLNLPNVIDIKNELKVDVS